MTNSLLDWSFKDEHVQPSFSSFPPIGITELGTGKVKCAYCRRLYPSIPEKNCGSCGAADWQIKEEFLSGFRMRNMNGKLTAKDKEYLKTGRWS